MLRKAIKALLITIGCLAVIGLTAVGVLYYYIFTPAYYPTETAYVYIDRDDTADSIVYKANIACYSKKHKGFEWIARYKELDSHLHTGRYSIHKEESVYNVFCRILRGYQEPMNLTIKSVRLLETLAKNVGEQLMIDSVEIATRLFDTAYQSKLGFTVETMPCLFLPDTYQVFWDMSVEDFFNRMQQEYRAFWNEERIAKAKKTGLTPNEVCVLASIVEEETNNNDEKPMVAGLYLNRLRKKIPLQADPTVKFAMRDFKLRRITKQHLKTPSPYNTYLHAGLPPGPIRIPTKKGIESVLNYVKHPYIYMCAKEDFSGTHNFAVTYSEHLANAKRYWQALNQRKIFK